jgi:hypothetical protein
MNAISQQPPIISQMASGRGWDLMNPSADQVYWRDIADHLGRIYRFTGGTNYSVAQHCCMVADILPASLRVYGLLHDAHEAYLGDIAQPMKRALALWGGRGALDILVTTHDNAICKAAGIDYDLLHGTDVRYADNIALATERRDLCADSDVEWGPLPTPLSSPIRSVWPWPKAADEWLTRLHRWLPQTKLQG